MTFYDDEVVTEDDNRKLVHARFKEQGRQQPAGSKGDKRKATCS
jgi:hypothetical protein